jgi:hypothetical protein
MKGKNIWKRCMKKMVYKENPKTRGSGILGCIPQKGRCPNECEDCFFQSGRSYLEPLEENLPNMPSVSEATGRIIRVNDGNDSSVDRDLVIEKTQGYANVFYNTAIPTDLDKFPGPVVLTVNPGIKTDYSYYDLVILINGKPVSTIRSNLMFVRARTNTWNIDLIDKIVNYYSYINVPVVLTFMAYFDTADKIPEDHRKNYMFRKRTLSSYWAITTDAWEKVMERYKYNHFVYSCGKIEGEKGTTKCSRCGNCIREYYNTKERMRS